MALAFFFLLLLLPLALPSVAAMVVAGAAYSAEPKSNATEFIRNRCSTTLYPRRCYASLARYADDIQESPCQLVAVAVSVSLRRARLASAYLHSLCSNSSDLCVARTAAALHDCSSSISDAIDQMKQSLGELSYLKAGKDFLWHLSNVQTWMSAALTNEDTCTDGFEDLPSTVVKDDICTRFGRIKEVTSNALALVNSLASDQRVQPSEDADFDLAGGGF